jgi:hypothetical protein
MRYNGLNGLRSCQSGRRGRLCSSSLSKLLMPLLILDGRSDSGHHRGCVRVSIR